MAAGCVPVVLGKGGVTEIVEHGRSGYLWHSRADWKRQTLSVAGDPHLAARLREGGHRAQRPLRGAGVPRPPAGDRRAAEVRPWPSPRIQAASPALCSPAAGLAWLVGAVATGSRYPGLSLAWLLPAFLAFARPARLQAGAYAVARWGGFPPGAR